MNYKIGDKVKIKDKCELEGVFAVNDTMPSWSGQVATITQILLSCQAYKIDLDKGRWLWTDKMIECPVESKEEKEGTQMKYEVGDKVELKSKSELNNCELDTVSEMIALGGKVATITGIITTLVPNRYRIDLDDGGWSWKDDMFKGLAKEEENESEEEVMNNLKIGDKVRIRGDLSGREYNVAYEMEDYRDKIATIERLGEVEYGTGLQKYYLNIDDGEYFWTTKMFVPLALNFKEVVAYIEEGQTYMSEDGERTFTMKDGFFITQGFDESFSLDETFKLVKVLSLQDILVKENNHKTFKAVFGNGNTKIVEVRVYGENLELEDEDGDDINEDYCLSLVLNAKYYEV